MPLFLRRALRARGDEEHGALGAFQGGGGGGGEGGQRGRDAGPRLGAELAVGEQEGEVVEQRGDVGDQALLGGKIERGLVDGVRPGRDLEDDTAEIIRDADGRGVVGDLEFRGDEAGGGERTGKDIAGLEEVEHAR